MKKLLISLLSAGLLLALYVLFFNEQPNTPQPTPALPPTAQSQTPPAEAPEAPKFPTLSQNQQLPWEDAVSAAIDSSKDPSHVFHQLIAILKDAPLAAQGVLAKHLTNVASDDDFLAILPYIGDRAMSKQFHTVIATDLLNRPDAIKLPALLQVASSEWHPLHAQCLTFLTALTQENAEDDWAKWKEIVAAKLAPKPPESTPTKAP